MQQVDTPPSWPATVAPDRERLTFLDGIRGWGAVVVMLFHMFVDSGLRAWPQLQSLIHVIYLNGPFAVCVFFVVSGFSLSIGFVRYGGRERLARIAAGRYFRLAIPIFAICLLTDLFMRIGLVAPADERPFPFGTGLTFEPSIGHVIWFSLYDVFFNYHQDNLGTYNPPLWSMAYEFGGSFIVLGVLAACGGFRVRWLVYAVLLAYFLATANLFALFVAGVVLAELYTLRVHREPYVQPVSLFFILLATVWGFWIQPAPPDWTVSYFGCVLLLCTGFVGFAPARRFFETPVSTFLGRISFPLYLVQAVVLQVFATRSLFWLDAAGLSYAWAHLLTGMAGVAVCLLAAVAFLPANEAGVWVAREVGRLVGVSWRASSSRLLGRVVVTPQS